MITGGGDETVLKLSTGAQVNARIYTGAVPKPRKCLLLHGNPGSIRDWDEIAPRLGSVADVVAIDLPGFAKSPRLGPGARSMSLECFAGYAVAAREALGWTEAIFLVGHSHGGGVAQAAAALWPASISGIVLLGTLGYPAHSSYRQLSLPGVAQVARLLVRGMNSSALRPIIRFALHAAMRDVFAPQIIPTGRVERELTLFTERPEILRSMVEVALGHPCERLLDWASQGRCPALFLHGQDDRVVPWRCAKSIHERMIRSGRHSTFETVAGAGHMLLEVQAQAVAERIATFLANPRGC